MELELLKLFFPEELVAHFDITGSAIKQGKHGDYLEVEFTGSRDNSGEKAAKFIT